jgi:hypothetical protein
LNLIKRNSIKRKITEHYNKEINDGLISFENILNEFDFPVVTIDTDQEIQQIKLHFESNVASFYTFMKIETVSPCYKNSFLITGNFVGTKSFNNRRNDLIGNYEDLDMNTFEQLYAANILFKKDENRPLTLLTNGMPEDKNHDFFIKDFVIRLKEILK